MLKDDVLYDDRKAVAYVEVEMAARIRFTLRGRIFEKEPEDFVKAAKATAPGRIQKYSTVVGGKRYAIRQLVAAATGLPAIAITSQDAYRILEKFGFTVDAEE